MTFVSYAQNYEDVILRRALKDVKKGFYIDVGANDPVIDSVTKAFYDSGWRGINIEPVKEWFDKLRQERPDDINLQFAAGNQKGELDFYEVIGTGLSTMDKSIAERHVQERGYEIKNYKVPVTRLSTICEQHLNSEIHFLKIDVEGAEKSVLLGLNLHKIRPWIILVESTLPNSPVESYEDWEPIILAANYEYVYFDGLNRFYVAQEHQDIKSQLAIPPNVFDDFVLSGCSSSSFHSQVAQIQASLADAYNKQKMLEATRQETEQQNQQLDTQLQAMQVNARQRDIQLRDEQIKQQELLLKLTEKETRIKKAQATLVQQDELLRGKAIKEKEKEAQFQKAQATIAQRDELLRGKAIKEKEKEAQFQKAQATIVQRDELLGGKAIKEKELESKLARQDDRLKELSATLADSKKRVNDLYQSDLHWKLEAERLRIELRAVHNSKSWQITKPLRILWKPFDSKPKLETAKPLAIISESVDALDPQINSAPKAGTRTENKELSTDTILERIRTELASVKKNTK